MLSLSQSSLSEVCVDEDWNFSQEHEYLMHNMHTYPAKFPSFIATKAFAYAEKEGVNVNIVSDIFCGCGTVALEAKLHNKDFWGCDINPVATLIAKVKSSSYKVDTLNRYYKRIIRAQKNINLSDDIYLRANERLKYWFKENSYKELYKLKKAIDENTPNGKYKSAFYCVFSSILKSSSKWLTKSIKPQIDNQKKDIDIINSFNIKYKKFINSVEEINRSEYDSKIEIRNKNFLSIRKLPKVDLIISSPPYVTSYEYADLHQLSSLWLDYTDDYRLLRKGSIGSAYNSENFLLEIEKLNFVGKKIVQELLHTDKSKANIRSVARYYYDMQRVINQCSKMLNSGGMAFFVVGDTEYKGVKILNSEHLIQSLYESGFKDIKVSKRLISNKFLTPYRDSIGKFTSDKSQRTIYHEELIISGRI